MSPHGYLAEPRPEGDRPLYAHDRVKVGASCFAVDDVVYPLLLVSRVSLTMKNDRSTPRLTNDECIASWLTILFTSVILVGTGILAFVEGPRSLHPAVFVLSLLAVAAFAGAVASLRHHMRPVRRLYHVQVGDERGNYIDVLPWTYDGRAWSVATVLATGAELDSMMVNEDNSGWRKLMLPDVPKPSPTAADPAG